ncbi:hypothetical protein [Amycolatopsis sp. NPDC004378]
MKRGDITSWVSTSDDALTIGQDQRSLSDDVAKAVEELRQAYSGKGADAAINRFATFGNAVGVSGDSLTQNASNVQSTAAYYQTVAAKMEDVDPPAQKVFGSVTPWWVDSEAETKRYNQIQALNTQTYMEYYDHATSQGRGLQTDYGQLKPFDAGTVSIDPGTTGTKGTTGTTSRTTAGKHRAPDTGTVTPGTGTTPGTGPGQSPGGVGPGGTTPPGAGKPGGLGSDDGTGAAAYQPPATLPGGGLPGGGVNAPVQVPGGTGPGSGVSVGPFVGTGGLSGVGSGSGSGSGAGRLPGSGSGQAPGGGVRSGAGMVEGEPVARGGRGLAGSRLTGGSGGPGGMANGAGRGKGEEDKEHKRRYGLDEVVLFPAEDENDPDSGIDPVTGMRVTKPTIG